MDEQLLQEWLNQIRTIKEFLEVVESKIDDAERTLSPRSGVTIVHDLDVEDIILDIESVEVILKELQDSLESAR